jgi:hypothetical protein
MRHRVFIALSVAFLVFSATGAHAQSTITGSGGTVDTSTSPDVTMTLVPGVTSKFKILNSSNIELMRIQSNGYVGIGTGTDQLTEALQVKGAVKVTGATTQLLANSSSFDYYAGGARIVVFGPDTSTAATFQLFLKKSDGQGGPVGSIPFRVDSSGRVGIDLPDYGTLGEALQVNGAVKVTGTTTNILANSTSLDYLANATSGARIVSFGPNATTPATFSLVLLSSDASAGSDARLFVDAAGNIGINSKTPGARLDVKGGVNVSENLTVTQTITAGIIHATYQDVAEWVPAKEEMAAGTVVVVGEDADNTVTASMHAYDTSVAGVVSANPGLLLGVASASKAKIATTGRVQVRVDATKSPIRKGDLLVTSDQPGMAMKSEPLDLGGVKIHRPGTLIGKALEPLASGQGEILVLLSLQ